MTNLTMNSKTPKLQNSKTNTNALNSLSLRGSNSDRSNLKNRIASPSARNDTYCVCSRIAVLTINSAGKKLAEKLRPCLKNSVIIKLEKNGINKLEEVFSDYEGLIFIAALGIVVRLIAPFIKNKLTDPAVVCVDTAGRSAISVLSGHEGGANNLAYLAAGLLGAQAVITTGTEAHKKIILGIGCRRGISADKIKDAILSALRKTRVTLDNVRLAATVDLKKDEAGLIKACKDFGLPLVFIPKESIAHFSGFSTSEVVRRNIGLNGVCQPCAVLAGRKAKLICQKQIIDGVTVALAREN